MNKTVKMFIAAASAASLLCLAPLSSFAAPAASAKPTSSATPSASATPTSSAKPSASAKPTPFPTATVKPAPLPTKTPEPPGRVLADGFVETNRLNPIYVFLEYNSVPLANHPIFVNGNFIIAPVDEVCGMLGLKCFYNTESGSVRVRLDDPCKTPPRDVLFNVGSSTANVMGENKEMPGPAVNVDGVIYVPLRPLAEAFGSNIEFSREDGHYNVNLSQPALKAQIIEADNAAQSRVSGISSQTNYLIYVSKPEYLVRVYLRNNGGWELIKKFDCAIGAPDRPTVEGEFTYYQWENMWDYGTYYVGPVLRFYYGYALHSTLLNKNGGDYDNRTGVQISHGCVRLRKDDIEWLSYYIPLKTKVFIS